MERLKIGIVGAGAIAQRNAREAVRSGAAELAGIFDVNAKVAREMSRALSAPFCPTLENLLETPGLEAVLISTPHHLHRPQGVLAAERGKHVLIEKPLANNLAEADAILEACRRHGVALTVNFSFRFLPEIQKARELIREGALGEITGIQIVMHQYKDPGYWTGARSNSPDDWRVSREKAGGGFLIVNVCHVIDAVYHMTGLRASRVYGEYASLGSPAEVEDVLSVAFRLENGGIGGIVASSILRGADQNEQRIWGTKGTIILRPGEIEFYSTRPVEGKRPGRLYRLAKFPETSWTARWVSGFATAVREGSQPEISGREGWENLAFVTGVYRSLEEGRPLALPKFEERVVHGEPRK